MQLVIHVGDLRYRGEDNWKSWEEDFFKPAEKLLKAAPWIVVRGNHDNCHNGKGKGWLFFFEPSFAGGTKCEDSKASNALKPYAIDPSDDLRFVVLDSANARYKCNTWLQKFKNFENDLSQLFPQKTDEKHGKQFWLLTHYPIWRTAEADDTSCRSDNDDIHSTDRYRWSIVDTLDNRLVHAVLSGDTHHFEFIGEGNPVRLHVVAGNGGTYLEGDLGPAPTAEHSEYTCGEGENRGDPVVFLRDFHRGSSTTQVYGKAVCEYGFVLAERDDKNKKKWLFKLKPVSRAARASDKACPVPLTDWHACYYQADGIKNIPGRPE